MLDWLKEILGEAYSEEIDERVSKEIGKAFVSKADFNAKVKKAGEYEKQISAQEQELEALRASNVDAAAVQKQIDDLNKAHAAEIEQIKLSQAVEKALVKAHAHNPATVLPLLQSFLKDAKLDEHGDVEGLDEQIQHLTDDNSTAFLFDKSKQAAPDVAGAEPVHTGNINKAAAKLPKDMSYDELCEYLEENPNAEL